MKIKIGDILAVLYFLAYTCIIVFFPLSYGQDGLSIHFSSNPEVCLGENFKGVVDHFPYISGFLKVGLLATFGEMLKVRGKTGSWKTPGLFLKFLVWGSYGMLFTIAFALFGKGIGALMNPVPADAFKNISNSLAEGNLDGAMSICNAAANTPPSAVWPFHLNGYWPQRILQGFSTSLWANLIFCYPMMLSHEYWNTCINRKRFLGGAEFLEGIDKHLWGSYLLKTIVVFWIPAHTITFSLPSQYQVLMSAYLSLALGFILTIKPKKKAE